MPARVNAVAQAIASARKKGDADSQRFLVAVDSPLHEPTAIGDARGLRRGAPPALEGAHPHSRCPTAPGRPRTRTGHRRGAGLVVSTGSTAGRATGRPERTTASAPGSASPSARSSSTASTTESETPRTKRQGDRQRVVASPARRRAARSARISRKYQVKMPVVDVEAVAVLAEEPQHPALEAARPTRLAGRLERDQGQGPEEERVEASRGLVQAPERPARSRTRRRRARRWSAPRAQRRRPGAQPPSAAPSRPRGPGAPAAPRRQGVDAAGGEHRDRQLAHPAERQHDAAGPGRRPARRCRSAPARSPEQRNTTSGQSR